MLRRSRKASSTEVSRTRTERPLLSTRSRTAVERCRETPSLLIRPDHEVVVLGRHQDAAVRLHSLNRQIEDKGEEFGQRPVAGQLVSRPDERRHVRSRESLRIGDAAIAFDDTVEVRGNGRSTGVFPALLARIEDYNRFLSRRTGAVVHQNQMSGGDSVAGFQRHAPGDFGAVEHGSVLTAEVAQGAQRLLHRAR